MRQIKRWGTKKNRQNRKEAGRVGKVQEKIKKSLKKQRKDHDDENLTSSSPCQERNSEEKGRRRKRPKHEGKAKNLTGNS